MYNCHTQVLTLSGSPYRIGFKHGKKARNKVHTSLTTYEKMFKDYVDISWKEACEKALLHVREIEKYNPNYINEMEGIANGAGVRFEDILALNARSEIALISALDGCTSFALTKPKTVNTWLAQNWDWRGSQIDSLIQVKIESENFPSIEMITEAGIIGKIGCNDAGIGVCLNALVTDTWRPKVPVHLGLRAILESKTIEEALSKVQYNQMASSVHFLIGSKTGKIKSVEASPICSIVKESKNGMIAHTNHIFSVQLKKKVKEDPFPDSLVRLKKINNKLEKIFGNTKHEILFQILSDHDNFPHSICRHESFEQSGRSKIETVFSIVMNLSQNEVSWIKGKPCEYFPE